MVDNGKLCAIMLWVIWPVGLILYLVNDENRNNPFVKFHLKQWLTSLVVGVGLGFTYILLSLVTFGMFAFIGWVLYIPSFVWFVQGIIYAAQGEMKEVWLIGKYAEQWFKF
jgi:uncharacterized membrane protein